MGLSKSIRRRWKATKGDPISTKISIFFADKQTRRNYEIQKFGRHLQVDDLLGRGKQKGLLSSKSELATVKMHLDADWYSEVHGIIAQEALEHYCKEGRALAYAPNPHLAEDDLKALTPWGLEYLIRCGIKIGCRGEGALLPDDPTALDPKKLCNKGEKKIAVVTAIFGGYDTLMPVDQSWHEDADFFVFSDRVFRTYSGWQPVHAPYQNSDPRRKARYVKLNLPDLFKSYDWVIWVDGNVLLCRNPRDVISGINGGDFDFSTYQHPQRGSIIAEAAACSTRGKDDPKEIARHLSLISDKLPNSTTGLFETMVMVLRPNSTAVQKVFRNWWELLDKGSKRDQLSLPVAMSWVPNMLFTPLHKSIERSADFYRSHHNP